MLIYGAFRSRPIAGTTFAAGLACLAAIGPTAAGAMQQCSPATCFTSAGGVSGPVLEPLMFHTGTCSVDGQPASTSAVSDGAFVKLNTDMKQGGAASLTGHCIIRGCSGPNCVSQPPQDRDIFAVWLGWVNPNGQFAPSNYNLQNVGPNGTIYEQSIDSRIVGSTNPPINRKPNSEGTWEYRYWVQSTVTSCNIQPGNHPEQRLKVNVLGCRPEWWVISAQNVHPPSGPITIGVPLGFEDAIGPLQDAVQSLAGLGREVNVIPDHTCPAGSGSCVRLAETHSGAGCASIAPVPQGPTGEWSQSLTINLTPTWRNAHPDRLSRRLAHELGHYFGLDDMLHSSCPCSSTSMGTAQSGGCDSPNAPNPLENCAPVATYVDVFALNESTFGNGNRRICGW